VSARQAPLGDRDDRPPMGTGTAEARGRDRGGNAPGACVRACVRACIPGHAAEAADGELVEELLAVDVGDG